MNILILSWRGPNHPHAGGAEIVTLEHAKAWVKSGHNVTLFTSAFLGSRKNETIEKVNIIRKGREILGVHFEAFFWYLFQRKQEFDLVIDEFHGIPFFTPLYVTSKKLAYIHEVSKEVWFYNYLSFPLSKIIALIGIVIEPLIFKLIYKKTPFLTVSNSTKKDLLNWGVLEKNITVINNGINLPPIIKAEKEAKKTLIFLGALTEDKGLEKAIEVLNILKQKDEDWQLWIVGRGERDYLNKIEEKVKKLRLEDNVKFWGYVSEKQKYQLLKKAHILINPSIWEGWGLVVLEAASVGTPTVAYDVPGLRDSILDGKTGLLCNEKNNTALANKVISLISNKEYYESIQKNALFWSKKFNWKKSTTESTKLIEHVAK